MHTTLKVTLLSVIPMIHPQIYLSVYSILEEIFLYLPNTWSTSTLNSPACIFLGPCVAFPPGSIMDAFLDYLAKSY